MGKGTLDFDASDFLKRIDLGNKKVNVAAASALLACAGKLEEAAKNTAPKEEGTLEHDIEADTEVTRKGNTIEAAVHAGTKQSRNYALRMHESLLPAIPTMDRQFRPGEITAGRPAQPWGAAGGKYLTRPLMYKMKEFMQLIADKVAGVK